jgi:hypothetical protein
MISYTVFQFTQRATENRSTCHAWQVCRRLPTPVLEDKTLKIASSFRHSTIFWRGEGNSASISFSPEDGGKYLY